MTHRRTEIRHQFLATLGQVETAQGNVFISRAEAVEATDRLPAVVFDEVDEGRERVSKDDEWERAYQVRTIILAQDPDTRDQVELEVEVALAALGATPRRGPESASFEVTREGERTLFSSTTSFQLTYYTPLHAPARAV